MKRACLLIIFMVFQVIFADNRYDFTLGNLLESREQCSGMYGRNNVNKKSSTIEVLFSKNQEEYRNVYIVIFEWENIRYFGKTLPDNKTVFICNDYAISKGLCESKDINTLLTNIKLEEIPTIFLKQINIKNTTKIEYRVKNTGYYCVGLIPIPFSKYFATINWNNYYGKLPASEYPKLAFYAFISTIYLFIGFFWGVLCIKHRKNILSVQKYITAIIIFLIVEMIILCGYYKYININGYDSGSFIYLSVVALINAARSSFSLFILLVVSMGYSIVKPTLGPVMIKCRLLAAFHFLSSVIYIIVSAFNYWINFFPFIIISLFLLSLTFSIFYFWTIYSLNKTIVDLDHRKQYTKGFIYKKLRISLFFTLVLITIYTIIRIIFISRENLKLFAPLYWRIRWLVLYGFLDILYLIVFVTIIVLWRPTVSNIRLAISDEVVQEDDFEVDDLDFSGTGNSSPNSSNKASQEFFNDIKKPSNREKGNFMASKHMFSIDDGQFHEIDEKNINLK
ncbi:hypothetical protein PNEG_01600 [Pneumocystis murina B123]|uniref:Intimal thickness related receptor IRP domain-containing protein n=1 Tax=Pneumocystis murina (strain B123) TaxID=1069680 RepID=M7NSU9_PNEMU|nr:hypothetical protein PNEG_01600 [Pneumocystis murina B123]EMR10347.1 hypothetical protein PNEG_01600 [Pneumocystis murina B123]